MPVGGSKSSFFAVRNQYGEPVSSPKCHAIAERKYASVSEGGTFRGKCSNEKSAATDPVVLRTSQLQSHRLVTGCTPGISGKARLCLNMTFGRCARAHRRDVARFRR